MERRRPPGCRAFREPITARAEKPGRRRLRSCAQWRRVPAERPADGRASAVGDLFTYSAWVERTSARK